VVIEDTAYLSTTVSPDPLPPPGPEHRHNLIHAEHGIGCRGCDLWVPKPEGMPNYDGAARGDW
jgi:hypothetical protein